MSQQIAIIYAAGEGYLDDLPSEQVRPFEAYLIQYLSAHHSTLMERLERGDWSRRVRRALPQVIEDCLKAFSGSADAPQTGAPADNPGERLPEASSESKS